MERGDSGLVQPDGGHRHLFFFDPLQRVSGNELQGIRQGSDSASNSRRSERPRDFESWGLFLRLGLIIGHC